MLSLEELEQDPFDATEFVERLAWRAQGSTSRTVDDFDHVVLHSAFVTSIQSLKELQISMKRKGEKLEQDCQDEEHQHFQRITGIQKHNKVAFDTFATLDERINFVATKVVHLGDQLEGVNTPRTRAFEALNLMKFYKEFADDSGPFSEMFRNPSQVQLAADIIQKLYLLVMELPQDGQFAMPRQKVLDTYQNIEKQLLQDFRTAYRNGEVKKMKKLTGILSNFTGFSQCIDIFVQESVEAQFLRKEIFDVIPPLCERTYKLIQEVFANPDVVMAKFIQHVYDVKLQNHISNLLKDQTNLETYLKNLNTLYVNCTQLSSKLSTYKIGSDASYLNKVTKEMFRKYLESYPSEEVKFLRERCSHILSRYYQSKGHQKKSLPTSGGLNDLRREVQNVLGAANLNIGPTIDNYQGETFLSQEVAINLMQESKMAFKRCQVLSSRIELANNAVRIFDILVQYLCLEHIEYAVVLGLQAIPLADPKTEPEIYFFEVVGQANTIFHLFQKQYNDHLLPLVSGTPRQNECQQKRREISESLENRLDLGLDRSLASVAGWVKNVLRNEQKVTDFKPETNEMQMSSQACQKVLKYMKSVIKLIRDGLDGKNVEACFSELGVRFQRVVWEHLQNYQFNSMGATLAICDMNEYRGCVKDMDVPLVIYLFDTLHSLCNLLVVVPDNLTEVCRTELLASLDKSVLHSAVSLRADYKTSRLASYFK